MNPAVDLSARPISELPKLVVPGRVCGSCSLCCKVFAVPDFQKPRSILCSYCDPGAGCRIHASRPAICREFFCNWLLLESLGPEWKPDSCHFVLQSVVYPGGHQSLGIHVDPEYPDSWRQEPFHSRIRGWTNKACAQIFGPIYFVVLQIDRRKLLLLPDSEIDLGEFAEDDRIMIERRNTPTGVTFVPTRHPPEHTAA